MEGANPGGISASFNGLALRNTRILLKWGFNGSSFFPASPSKPFELGRRQGMVGMLVLCGQPS